MARPKNNNQKKSNNGANVGYEAELWQMADALQYLHDHGLLLRVVAARMTENI